MNRVLAGLALVTLIGAAVPQTLDPAQFGWHTNYASAVAEARRIDKPIFLVFRCQP